MGGTLERILHDVHNVHELLLCERRERCVQRKRAFLFAMTWPRTKGGRFEPLLGQPQVHGGYLVAPMVEFAADKHANFDSVR